MRGLFFFKKNVHVHRKWNYYTVSSVQGDACAHVQAYVRFTKIVHCLQFTVLPDVHNIITTRFIQKALFEN